MPDPPKGTLQGRHSQSTSLPLRHTSHPNKETKHSHIVIVNQYASHFYHQCTYMFHWLYIYIFIITKLNSAHIFLLLGSGNGLLNNYYLYVQWVAMVFLVYFPRRWHAAAFSCNGSARGICADAYNYLVIIVLMLWRCHLASLT